MRIALVNDSLMAVEALRRILLQVSEYEIAWVAHNGAKAVELCKTDTPDLILMDLFMPVMNGVEATRQIMTFTPCPILVVTATVKGHAAKAFEAIGAGALDVVNTPVLGIKGVIDEKNPLLLKIVTIKHLANSKAQSKPILHRNPIFPKTNKYQCKYQCKNLIVIGASAGGPIALATILKQLPATLEAAIIIVQHIDSHFSKNLAEWLNDASPLPIRIAVEGDTPQTGTVLIAGRDEHLVFLNETTIGYIANSSNSLYHPSIDILFESVAIHWKGNVIALLLTGMGKDGAQGLKTLRDSGAITIAQDSESSVVYGMPKEAVKLGAAMKILPLNKIASSLTDSLALVDLNNETKIAKRQFQ